MAMVEIQLERSWYEQEKPVITNFALTVAIGEIVTIAGPSGVGKSTLLSILAGLNKKYLGHMEIGGSIALIPQKNCLLPFHTVWENVVLLAEAKGVRPEAEKVQELLRELGLADMGSKYPNQLSGGQYSRVALGQALFAQPDILLMDEPFSALDPGTKAGVIALFSRLQKERNITTVFVTHDMEEARAVGGRIVRLCYA